MYTCLQSCRHFSYSAWHLVRVLDSCQHWVVNNFLICLLQVASISVSLPLMQPMQVQTIAGESAARVKSKRQKPASPSRELLSEHNSEGSTLRLVPALNIL